MLGLLLDLHLVVKIFLYLLSSPLMVGNLDYKSIRSFRSRTLSGVKIKLQIGYSEIVVKRSKYNDKALVKLYSTHCDYPVLSLSRLFQIFLKTNIRALAQRIFGISDCYFICYHGIRKDCGIRKEK